MSGAKDRTALQPCPTCEALKETIKANVEDEDSRITRAVLAEVEQEHLRQFRQSGDGEGYCSRHDDQHTGSELAMAAACYVVPRYLDGDMDKMDMWPWDAEYDKRTKHHERKRLVIAAALIVSEIKRLDRDVLAEIKKVDP